MVYKWNILLLCALSAVSAQNGYSRDNPTNQLGYDSFNQGYSNNEDGDEVHGDEIPGEAGRDYPIYSEVPQTGFNCQNQQSPGYYADPEAQCQAFYICQKSGKSDGFLCPNGTVFNQQYLVCDWWYNFDCSQAEEFYSVNEQIAQAMQEADARLSQQQGGYNYDTPGGNQNGGDHSGRYSGPQPSGLQAPSDVYGVPSGNGNGRNNGNGHGNGNGRRNGNGNGRSNGNNHGNRNGNGGRNQNNISPVYGVPNQFGDSTRGSNGFNKAQQRNGNNVPRGYDSQNINNIDQSYGVPSFNGNGGKGNGNGNGNRNGGNRNGNGFNGNSPKQVYGTPSNGFSGLGAQQSSHGGFNGNGNELSSFRNGLGNAPTLPGRSYLPSKENNDYSQGGDNSPSSQYGVPNSGNGRFNFNELNAYNGESPSRQYGVPNAPDRSYLPQSK